MNLLQVTTLHSLNQIMLVTGLISHIVASFSVAGANPARPPACSGVGPYETGKTSETKPPPPQSASRPPITRPQPSFPFAPPPSVFFFVVCWVAFALEMMRVHVSFLRVEDRATLLLNIREQSFKSAMRDPRAPAAAHEIDQFRQSAETTLRMIRHLHWTTISLWTAFGINDTLIVMGLLPPLYAEHAWALLDMLAKVLFSSMLSMTAVVSLDEAEKQSAWLNEEKAREAIRSSEDIMYEASSRTETLTKLCQEGWGLVVQTFMQKGIVPIVTLSAEDGSAPDDDALPNVDRGFGAPAGGLSLGRPGPAGGAPAPAAAAAVAAVGAPKQRPVTGRSMDASYGSGSDHYMGLGATFGKGERGTSS